MTTTLRPESEALRPAVAARPMAIPWATFAQVGVAGLAALIYIVNLTVSGFANTYYSAAALAASQSWSAWFFGSIDASNFITVDKPPLSTMVMGLSVRLFGRSSWSVLLPEALMGAGTIVILMAIVRRTMGSPAAVIAGLVAALTPAAVLIFRASTDLSGLSGRSSEPSRRAGSAGSPWRRSSSGSRSTRNTCRHGSCSRRSASSGRPRPPARGGTGSAACSWRSRRSSSRAAGGSS